MNVTILVDRKVRLFFFISSIALRNDKKGTTKLLRCLCVHHIINRSSPNFTKINKITRVCIAAVYLLYAFKIIYYFTCRAIWPTLISHRPYVMSIGLVQVAPHTLLLNILIQYYYYSTLNETAITS